MMDRISAMSSSYGLPAAADDARGIPLRRFVSDRDGSDAVVRADATRTAIAPAAPFTERTQQ